MDKQSLKICVCGAGTMGTGIAQVCALHGYEVILFDVNSVTVSLAENKIKDDLQLLVAKNKLPVENKILERLQFTSSISKCVADLIIEAVVEQTEVKAALLNSLAQINSPSTVFATNTSSLSVTAIAEQMARPGQLAGMHFFNPATVMKLVEVVRTKHSSDAVIISITELAKSIGKVPVLCSDAPGFIVNHVARPFYLEALYLTEKYHAEMLSVDLLMESAGFRMGPFKLMDLIGNDINYAVTCMVHEALGQPERLRPSPIQQQKVASGQLGRKTGSGYYEYSK